MLMRCRILFIGMNKLLQRLPDRHNEEVRNQAIVLIQELTTVNEELKKTVVFNEVERRCSTYGICRAVFTSLLIYLTGI